MRAPATCGLRMTTSCSMVVTDVKLFVPASCGSMGTVIVLLKTACVSMGRRVEPRCFSFIAVGALVSSGGSSSCGCGQGAHDAPPRVRHAAYSSRTISQAHLALRSSSGVALRPRAS